jgi:hypothetical protein
MYKYELKKVKAVTSHASAVRGVRGIALPVLDPDARRGWVVSVTPRPFYLGKIDPVPIIQGSGWVLCPIWMGLENLPATHWLSNF